MSSEGRQDDARRWLAQGRDDLEAAEALVSVGKHAQASFLAQRLIAQVAGLLST